MQYSTDDILMKSTVQLARALAAGTVSATAVVERLQQRIATVNPALNAVVQQTGEHALAEAQAADRARARGVLLGPLHGVPFTVKDTFDVAGVVGAMGI